MKFFAYVALVGSAAAVRLTHYKSLAHTHRAPTEALAQLMELPSNEEVEEWVKAELEKDGSITLDEIKTGLEKWEAATGKKVTEDEAEAIELGFDMLDLDDDGHVTGAELQCVFEKKNCPPDDGKIDAHEITPEMY